MFSGLPLFSWHDIAVKDMALSSHRPGPELGSAINELMALLNEAPFHYLKGGSEERVTVPPLKAPLRIMEIKPSFWHAKFKNMSHVYYCFESF